MPANKTPYGGWRPSFIAALRNSGNVRAACQAAGISRQEAYRIKSKNKVFRAQWEEALVEAIELLEAEARRRAMTTSDLLMIFLLKAHKPDMYRDVQHHEVSGPEGRPIEHVTLEIPNDPARLREVISILQQAGDLTAPPFVSEGRANGFDAA